MKRLFTLFLLVCFAFAAYGQSEAEMLQKAASGDAEAQYELGFCYYYGLHPTTGLRPIKKVDYDKAFKWYLMAARQGHAGGQYGLGCCYMHGHGVEKDKNKGEQWLRKSADQGSADAYFSLGILFKNIDKEQAVYWFKKYADFYYGKNPTCYELVTNEFNALGVEYHPGHPSSVAERNLANRPATSDDPNNPTDPRKQYELGKRCREEDLDDEKAIYWFKKAANQGYAKAQLALGVCYEEGTSVNKKDWDKAFYWYGKSAAQGNAEAQYHLGECYEYGIGTADNEKQAIYWYEKAARKGNIDAMESLTDELLDIDESRRMHWKKQMFAVYMGKAKVGDAEAQDVMGRYYYNGEEGVVSKDYAKAAYWLEKAVNNGVENSSTLSMLGELYSKGGYGLVKNESKAKYWKEKANEKAGEETLKMLFRF